MRAYSLDIVVVCCLSLKVVGVSEAMDYCCKVLNRGTQQGVPVHNGLLPLQVGCCVPLHHWVVQDTKQQPFPIHAGSVYTICILFLSFSLLLKLPVVAVVSRLTGLGYQQAVQKHNCQILACLYAWFLESDQ
jgi:hypothetical protein